MSGQLLTFALLGQVARYTEALAKDPQSTAFVPLAEIFRQHGLLVEACAVAEKGVQTLPDHAPGFVVLGRIQAQLGQLNQATAAFERTLELDESNDDGLKGLARVCLLQGDSPRARRLLDQVLALNPDDDTARNMLGSLPPEPLPASQAPEASLAGGKESSDAAEPPRSSRGGRGAVAASGPISTATIADIYVRQGFTLRALKVYRDLLQADPHNEEIRRKLVALKERIEREEREAGGRPTEPPAEKAGRFAVAEADKSAFAEPAKADAGAGVVVRLEKWLSAIALRRGHV